MYPTLKRKQINVLVGSRRAGKTTILHQIAEYFLKLTRPQNCFYISIDDPRFFQITIYEHLDKGIKNYNYSRDGKIIFLIDEIQTFLSWKDELEALYDRENVKF